MDYFLSTAAFTGITLVGVLGVYLITGLTGLFSLGQAAFMAIGGYVAAVLVKNLNVPVPLAVVAAIATGTLAGLLVGYPTVRLRRDYISLVTLGFGEAIVAVLNNSANITGGAMGISGIPQLTTLPVLGVPIRSKALSGLDSLLSIVQMPPGIPVATMAVDGARNAGLLALRILALSRPGLGRKLADYAAGLDAEVKEKAGRLEAEGPGTYLAEKARKG